MHFSKTELLSLDRVSQFALIATRQAVAIASLNANDIERAGILYGAGFGGASTLEAAYVNYFGVKNVRECSQFLWY